MNDVHTSAPPPSEPQAQDGLTQLSDRRGETITLTDKVVGAGLWAAGAVWMAPMLGSMTVLQQLLSPERLEPLSRLYTRGQIALTGSKWRAVVHPEVDPHEVYMFAQNHTNFFDHVTMYNATPHFKQGLELESHFGVPVYGRFMKSRGTIPVPKDRRRRVETIRRRMQQEVEKGRSILTFPEGTRTLSGRVGPFRTGVFRVARDLGIPVVPVAVTGMYDVMRKGSWIIRPGHTVTVYVERPIPTKNLGNDEIAEVAEQARSVVAARVDEYYRRTRSGEAGSSR
jgi:1-acyl-sn-glycerol-3-phosphate acyltransferase